VDLILVTVLADCHVFTLTELLSSSTDEVFDM